MGMIKIHNVENFFNQTCCPPHNCNAIITGIEVSEELTFTIKTTGSQGGHVRVAVYSASLNSYLYADWQVCGINEFVFLNAALQPYFEAEDIQFIVQTSTDAGLTVCSESSVPLFNTSQVVEYTETGEIELVPELTPGTTCAGTLTHSIIYNNGLLFDSADLSIDEAGNGTLELGGLPLDDANGIILIGYYCDGILVAILAVNLTLLMFDVRVLGTDVDCEDEVLTATFVITNMGTNTIPSGTEFNYEFTTDPELTEVVGQVVSGTYTLLVDLAPTETIEMSIEYENPDCLTGSDITLTITEVPVGYGNFNPATLTDDITYEYVAPPMGLRMLFDDIANAPVADPTIVGQWNTFYNLPTNGAVFTSVSVTGNEVILVGGGAMTIKPSAFINDASLIEAEDQAGIVIAGAFASFELAASLTTPVFPEMLTAATECFFGCTSVIVFDLPKLQTSGTDCFSSSVNTTTFTLPDLTAAAQNSFWGCTSATTFTLPALLTTGVNCFFNCISCATFSFPLLTTAASATFRDCFAATLINIPLCVNLGNDPTDASVFDGITGQTITLNIAAVNATNNAGGVHASVAYLIANNTATVNYI
jgi:hypothetical protein